MAAASADDDEWEAIADKQEEKEDDWEAAADADEEDWESSVGNFKALTVKSDHDEEDEWEVKGSDPSCASSNRRADAYSGEGRECRY